MAAWEWDKTKTRRNTAISPTRPVRRKVFAGCLSYPRGKAGLGKNDRPGGELAEHPGTDRQLVNLSIMFDTDGTRVNRATDAHVSITKCTVVFPR